MSSPPLLNMLGASWDFGAPVVALAWDGVGDTVGFALGDGHLAVTRALWPKGPRVEPRPEGGVGMVPAEEAAPRPVRVACHPGTCLSLVSDGPGSFLTGGDDGRASSAAFLGRAVLALGLALTRPRPELRGTFRQYEELDA